MRFADVVSGVVLNIFVAESEESASQFATGEAIQSNTAQIGFIVDAETGELVPPPLPIIEDAEEIEVEEPEVTEETPAE